MLKSVAQNDLSIVSVCAGIIDGETLEEIAESFPEKPDVRTIHRYIARGIEELSVLLWGVIGLNTKLS